MFRIKKLGWHWWKSNLHKVLGLIVTTRTVSHLNFLFFLLSAMAASSSQPETMKAECSLDNPKVYSFFLILFKISCILFLLHYIQCHFMAFGENFTIIWWCVPKRNIKSRQMLCKNCFYQKNRKLHRMAWSCPFSAWVQSTSGMEWTLHLGYLFVWLMIQTNKFENIILLICLLNSYLIEGVCF